MKFETLKPTVKIALFAGVLVAVLLIIFFGIRSSKKNRIVLENEPASLAQEEAPSEGIIGTSQADTTSSKAVVDKASIGVAASQVTTTPTVTPIISSVEANPGATEADTKHGVFRIMFNVKAGDRNVYINPTCQTVLGAMPNGVTFTLIKDGVTNENAELSSSSCVVLNRGLAEKTNGDNFLVRQGQENAFELVVVHHPKNPGNYKVRITQVGYSTIDGRGDKLFFIGSADAAALSTQAVTL